MTRTRTGPPTDTGGLEISPTRIKKFDEQCQRRWAFAALLGQHEPATEAMRFGTRLHSVGESWFKDGTPPDLKTKEGGLFATGMQYLPTPGPGVRSEMPVTLDLPGFTLPGTADLVDVTGPGAAVLYDYKTTSAPRWIPTPSVLLCDTQALVYALATMRTLDLQHIDCRWVYFIKTGEPRSTPVNFRVHRTHAERYCTERIVPAVEAMLQLHQDRPGILDVPPAPFTSDDGRSFTACHAYSKPCTYLDTCTDRSIHSINDPHGGATVKTKTKTQQRKAKPMATNELFAKLRAAKAAQATPPEAPPPATVNAPEGPAPTPPPEADEKPKAKTKKPRKKKAPAPAPAVDATTAPAPAVDATTAAGLIVCVNCFPAQGSWPKPVPLTELAAQACIDAAAAEGVPDWRLIDFKAAGVLAYHFEQYLLDNPPTGVVFVDRFSAEGKALLSSLENVASVVIRGC